MKYKLLLAVAFIQMVAGIAAVLLGMRAGIFMAVGGSTLFTALLYEPIIEGYREIATSAIDALDQGVVRLERRLPEDLS